MTTERTILFSAPMVRALRAGTKTQTRRPVNPQPETQHDGEPYWHVGGYRVWGYRPPAAVPLRAGGSPLPCPYGQPGNALLVRETCRAFASNGGPYSVLYTADAQDRAIRDDQHAQWAALHSYGGGLGKQVPSIHMPRWASRITLEITEVHVERLQDISEADAQAEGIVRTRDGWGLPDGEHYHHTDPRQSYLSLWEAINGPGSVEANPWVWVVSFKRVEG